MKKQKPPEFDSELLLSIPIDRREEFKATVRRKRYLASGLFFFMWHFCLFGLLIPSPALLHALWPRYARFMTHLFGWSAVPLEAFFLMVLFGLWSRPIRHKLNQKGIHTVHILFILLPVFYSCYYWIMSSTERGY